MKKKIIFSTCIILFILFYSIIFGMLLKLHFVGDDKFRKLSSFANYLAQIPFKYNPKKIILDIKRYGNPEIDLEASNNKVSGKKQFNVFKKKKRDDLLMLSRYDGDLKRSIVQIISLNDYRIIHEYKPDINHINQEIIKKDKKKIYKNILRDSSIVRNRIYHPVINKEGDMFFSEGVGSPLIRVDFCGNLKSINLDRFHHSLNFDDDGNLWGISYMTPYSEFVQKNLPKDTNYFFYDDGITKLDKNGELIWKRSFFEILVKNNLLKNYDQRLTSYADPLHVNDVQPVSSDGAFWKKGDLFISTSKQHTIYLYRPSEDRIIKSISGHFDSQHDVDIYDSTSIIFYNNNRGGYLSGYNQILKYDFANEKISTLIDDAMKEKNIYTAREGLADILSDGSFMVEESNEGRLFIIDKNGNLEFQFNNIASENKGYILNWSRIIKDKKIINSIKEKINKNIC